MKRAVIFLSAAIILTVGCRQKGAPAADLLPSAAFDTTINNVPVALYTLSAGDITMQVTNFGGRVVTLDAGPSPNMSIRQASVSSAPVSARWQTGSEAHPSPLTE